jgi:hypothetical protein
MKDGTDGRSEAGERVTPLMTPRSLRPAATIVTVLIAVHAVLALVAIAVTVSEISLLRRIKARDMFTLEEAQASDARVRAVALILVGTLVAAGIGWLVWQYRAHANLRATGVQGLEYSPGWGVGWWFVPVASFWKVYGAVRELWLASGPGPFDTNLRTRSTPGILKVWWFLWVLANVAAFASLRLAGASEIDGLILSDLFSIADDTLTIGAAIPAILIVRSISTRQDAMSSSAVPIPPPPKDPAPASSWVMIVLGIAALILGLVTFVRTNGGISPILLIGITMILISASIRRRARLRDATPPPLPPPPQPSSSVDPLD